MARKDRLDRRRSGVTSIDQARNTTTGKQFPLRLTDEERNELSLLTEKVQALFPNKKISLSRVLRASVFVQDSAHIKKLAKSVIENT
ncbi:hypothetical protein H0A36_27080 [Endozoicomonas sp. SM1973]|uniref:Uncharacterized protein n=1 Tax=Spartinivicinus marinus TaxID=2994442 RepID=A0A853I8P6_9GAMM|nr:hypothetical protein [Spartinivicinus marinus]NYZ69683.1 hypothetical protein [Spartinivicinus marinus]